MVYVRGNTIKYLRVPEEVRARRLRTLSRPACSLAPAGAGEGARGEYSARGQASCCRRARPGSRRARRARWRRSPRSRRRRRRRWTGRRKGRRPRTRPRRWRWPWRRPLRVRTGVGLSFVALLSQLQDIRVRCTCGSGGVPLQTCRHPAARNGSGRRCAGGVWRSPCYARSARGFFCAGWRVRVRAGQMCAGTAARRRRACVREHALQQWRSPTHSHVCFSVLDIQSWRF